MSIGEAVAPPERMHLIDLSTAEDFEVLFNPEVIQEDLQVIYARQTVPGLSHQVLQYTHTGNEQVALDLYAYGEGAPGRILVDDFRRFLKSLCYPRGFAGTIDDGAPPRVLFVWPNVWTWTCVITSLRFANTQFSQEGEIIRTVASVMLEEIRDIRLTSEEVRAHGTRRSATRGGA